MNNKKIFKHASDNILELILESPYIIEFSEGILPQEQFHFFKVQDILYLKEFSRGLAMIGEQEPTYHEKFITWSKGVNEELNVLQNKYKTELVNAEKSPTNLLYTSFLMKIIAENKFYKSLASFYACHWIYYKVGQHLYKISSKSNPYQEWIEFYHSEDFAKIVKEYKSILYKTIENLNEDQVKECIECFRLTSKMEFKFWDSAYNYEAWPFQEIKFRHKPICVLAIAGSDSSGGAGIQADLNTFHSHKVVGSSLITAITAQNSLGVSGILGITADLIEKQMKSVFEDYDIKAVKIGMIYDKEIIKCVANYLKSLKGVKIVVDPVMISTSGCSLIKDESLSSICEEIFPLADIITPNIPEAVELVNAIQNNDIKKIESLNDMRECAKKISDFYKIKSVLIKGGHLKINDKAIDLLFIKSEQKEHFFEKKYLFSKNTHGTGCSLSSAIAANLGKGYSLISAIKCAKNYVFDAINKGYKLGKGEYGTLCHFY